MALRDAIRAQFGGLPGALSLQSFDRLRRRRNAAEYLEANIDAAEAAEARHRAESIVEFSASLVAKLPTYGR